MAKIKGENLMVFKNDRSIAYATNHTLNIDAEFDEQNINKDDYDEDWGGGEIKRLNWTITSDNFYSVDGQGNLYDDIEYAMLAMQPFDIVFGRKNGTQTNVPTGGWRPTQGLVYSGKAMITKLELDAQVGEYARFNVEMQGVGALTIRYNYDMDNGSQGSDEQLEEYGNWYDVESYDNAIRNGYDTIEFGALDELSVKVGDIMRLKVYFAGGENFSWWSWVEGRVTALDEPNNQVNIVWSDTLNRYKYYDREDLELDGHDYPTYISGGLTLTGDDRIDAPVGSLVCISVNANHDVLYGEIAQQNENNTVIGCYYFHSDD